MNKRNRAFKDDKSIVRLFSLSTLIQIRKASKALK